MRSVARKLIPINGASSQRGLLDPIKPAYDQHRPDVAQLAASVFNRLDHYASSPGNRAYCYAELAVSSLAVAETIIVTSHGGMARLSWPGWLVTHRGGMPARSQY